MQTSRGVDPSTSITSAQAESSVARSGTPVPTPEEMGGQNLWPGSYFFIIGRPKLTLKAECSFLSNTAWNGVGRRHIRIAFNTTFQWGSLTGRHALTQYPLTFDSDQNPTCVYLFWTDSKSILREGFVELQDIGPAQPKKKGLHVMLLDGAHVGEIVSVTKVSKATGKVSVGAGSGKPWEESLESTCIVEDHMDAHCDACSKWVRM